MTSDPAELERFLAGTPFFGGLSEAALARIAALLVPRGFPAGATIFEEGDQGRAMYIVESGELMVCCQGESGHRVRLVRLGPGDFFGEMTLIEMQPRSNTVVVERAACLLELTNMDLYKLYREDVKSYVMVLQNINRELCRRLRKSDGRITQIADRAQDEVTQIRTSFPRRPG